MRARGPLLLAAGAALWGTTGTSQALLDGAVPPAGVGALRVLIGGLVLGLVAGPRLVTALPTLRAARGPLLAAAVATAAYQPAFFLGVREAGVAVGTLVTVGAAPFLAGALGAVLGDHRPSGRWVAVTVVAAVGLVLLAGPTGTPAPSALGVTAALGAALAFAAYTVAAKRLLRSGVAPTIGVAATFLLAAGLLLPVLVVALRTAAAPERLVSAGGAAVLIWLGVGATAAAYLLFTAGLRSVPAVTGATLALAEPLTATALGTLVLGERLGAVGLVGGAVLALALVVAAARPEHDAAPGAGRAASRPVRG